MSNIINGCLHDFVNTAFGEKSTIVLIQMLFLLAIDKTILIPMLFIS